MLVRLEVLGVPLHFLALAGGRRPNRQVAQQDGLRQAAGIVGEVRRGRLAALDRAAPTPRNGRAIAVHFTSGMLTPPSMCSSRLAVVAGRIELALVADRPGSRWPPFLFAFRASPALGFLPPSYQNSFKAGTLAQGRVVEGDDRPLRIAVLVVAGTLGLNGDRIAKIQGHVGHVHGVTGHVAQGAGAEIPPAAPGEGMIAVGIGPLRRGAEPEVPLQVLAGIRPARAARRPAARSAGWSTREPLSPCRVPPT